MSTKKVNKSAVLSVSIGKGCYRHIQVSLNESLEELADIILWAFDFCNDHAHAFFMDNKAWSNYDCYYMAEVDEENEYRHTCDVKLSKLGLQKDDKSSLSLILAMTGNFNAEFCESSTKIQMKQ